MIATMGYYYGYTPSQTCSMALDQIGVLLEQLPDLIEKDGRGRG